MSKDQNSFGGLLAAIFLGATAGAVTALLMAPDSGKKTRKKISKKLNNIQKKLNNVKDEGNQKVQNFAKDLKKNVSNIVEKKS